MLAVQLLERQEKRGFYLGRNTGTIVVDTKPVLLTIELPSDANSGGRPDMAERVAEEIRPDYLKPLRDARYLGPRRW